MAQYMQYSIILMQRFIMSVFYGEIGVVLRITAMVLVGLPLLMVIRRISRTAISQKIDPHIGLIVSKFIFYGGIAILVTMILKDVGFELTALLGAAGIAGIAIGFAAQTTISNMISGIFLLIERPFSVGDTITYESIIGTIDSVDLLSTKIKTLSGKRIRIPNELVIKEVFTNTTYYETRRITFYIIVAKNHDMDAVMLLLQKTASGAKNILNYPEPTIYIDKITYSGVHYTLHVWTPTARVQGVSRDLTYVFIKILNNDHVKIISLSHNA
jgi:small conductance mechanosensitive channel